LELGLKSLATIAPDILAECEIPFLILKPTFHTSKCRIKNKKSDKGANRECLETFAGQAMYFRRCLMPAP